MKKILPFIALALFTMSCAPPNKVNKTKAPKPVAQHDIYVDGDKQIAPGTCSLIVTDCRIESKDDSYKLLGKVQSIKAYGAAFNQTLSKNDEIVIHISKSQVELLEDKNNISCIILMKEGRYEPAFFELIKVK
ncbi:hypothetical protein GCQ56_04395 [Marinifilum sp. N1E240]|uniref:hypothetical protein n=1 Tax=Marinifilum sp. N1E240 TaxID=2608082 RepID=UPI00128BCF2D|nr:hypothetical protein [Marinifilum sp. N1E240]MPQ46242.1 hypothetical protein [Marinifilum sp. N1E240]